MTWRVTTSQKPRRQGEAFLMKGDTFVAKIYKDGRNDPRAFAQYLADQLNKIENKNANNTS